MAEIHCPNCGKINPEGKEVCDSCGFPLPSHTSSPNQETPSSSPDTPNSPPDLPSNAQDATPGEAKEDIPDGEDEGDAGWLDVLHAAEEGEEPSDLQTPSEEDEEEEKEDTDWLKRIRALDVEEEKGQEAPEGESFPTWMSEVEGEGKVEKTPAEEKQELPDWLQSEEEAGEAEPIVSEKDEEETAPPEPAQEKEGHFPSWLEEDEEASPAGEGPIQPFELDEDDEVIDDLFDEELPSWLTSVDMEKEDAETGDDISPGELPGWVEAMRPVVESSDTSGLAEDEEYIENYGPLAGIPSVLPAEADIDQTSMEEGSKLSFELQVSKTQKEYASLLENVISQEHKAKPKGEVASVATQRVLRWLIAIVLIIFVGASVITGGGAGPPPSPAIHLKDEHGPAALYEMIDEMEARDTALIAFDYQPALAGELNATASGVVDHLLRQESYLAFISTQATGPSLAEHFISNTQSEFEYQHGRDYINLGYIPGQAAGVLSFSIAPREIVPIAFNGANAWDSPPLKEIQTLSDFDLFLIITDDPTTARMWIEQVNPYISRYKVAMIVSAQAEPLVRPYFQNSPQQISGLVAGLPGGRAYEELAGSPNLSSVFLFPLNVGIIVTILTIFIGGLANGILNLIKQRKNKQKRRGS